MAYGFVAAAALCVVCLVAPGISRRNVHRLMRAWGRPILWLQGVRVKVEGREHLEATGAKLVLYNHQSTLDLFLMAAIAPPHALALYKADFHDIPLIGRAMRALGMVPVRLGNARQAVLDTYAAGRTARTTGATLMIAPEGARSAAGELQAFRAGAFRVAQREGLPIVPLVLHGAHDLLPRTSVIIRAGALVAEALPPIDTSGWDAEHLRERATEVRALFERALAARAP